MKKIKFQNNKDKVLQQMKDSLKNRINSSLNSVVSEMRRSIDASSQSRGGQTYTEDSPFYKKNRALRRRIDKDGEYTSSAPGEAPARRSSSLYASLSTKITEGSANPEADDYLNLSGTVYLDESYVAFDPNEYAAELEFGAPEKNLEPRPFFYPAFQVVRGAMRRNLVNPMDINT